jgi:hypothetical protein
MVRRSHSSSDDTDVQGAKRRHDGSVVGVLIAANRE